MNVEKRIHSYQITTTISSLAQLISFQLPCADCLEQFFSRTLKMSRIQNLEDCLEKYIPKEELKDVRRILYGRPDE